MISPSAKAIEDELPNLTIGEISDLAARLAAIIDDSGTEIPETDIGRYRGLLKPGLDGLEYQRQMRAEWDRD